MESPQLRAYDKMKPAQRKGQLGYALDREEALGHVVASALHKPMLTALEARTIGKRAGALPVFGKLAARVQKSGAFFIYREHNSHLVLSSDKSYYDKR